MPLMRRELTSGDPANEEQGDARWPDVGSDGRSGQHSLVIVRCGLRLRSHSKRRTLRCRTGAVAGPDRPCLTNVGHVSDIELCLTAVDHACHTGRNGAEGNGTVRGHAKVSLGVV